MTWTQTALNNRNILSLAVSGNNIFAGTYVYGVYLSTNNGSNWKQIAFNQYSSQYIYSLAVIKNYIFAGTSDGVYLTTNNGSNWTLTALNQYINSFAVSGKKIFAGTRNNGVYLSTNFGTSWTQTALNNKDVHSLAVSGSNIFAGTRDYGIYFSSNNGINWIQKNQGFGIIVPYVNAFITVYNNIFAAINFYTVWRREFSEIIGIQNISSEVPSSFSLEQNYPNPFNPSTNVLFSILNVQFVTLKVYDILGKEVATLINEKLQPGTYEVNWEASQFSSGVYFYRLTAGDFSEMKRMLMIK